MIYPVLIYPHTGLLTKAAEVTVFDDQLKRLIADLYETMYGQDGVGLAAPQVNISQRILVMDTSENRSEPRALINPEIVERDGEETATEGCLSFPGLYIDVTRSAWVKVRAVDENNQPVEYEADGLMARCIQHEMDHLDGVVFIDHLSKLKRQRAEKKLKKLLREQGLS